MKRMRLKQTNVTPPGGWLFHQNGKKWGPLASKGELVGAVSDYRRANNLPRSTSDEVDQEIEHFTCFRLGGDPNYCVGADQQTRAEIASAPVQGPVGCPGCGVRT